MGKKCCVWNCDNSVGKPKNSVHDFPRVLEMRDVWLTVLHGQLLNSGIFNLVASDFKSFDSALTGFLIF